MFTRVGITRQKDGLSYLDVDYRGNKNLMEEALKMARNGRVFLFGKGNFLVNPIHGADLARFCCREMGGNNLELDIGGPDTLTHNQIALQAFTALGKTSKIVYIPVFVTRQILFLMRMFTSSKTYGPVEFFMNVMTKNMTAPEFGIRSLGEHYCSMSETKTDE